MQRTRLNSLADNTGARLEILFSNPWRRIALSLISILLGFFMGSAIVTTAGQDAVWDVPAAIVLLTCTELASKFVYSRRNRQSATSLPVRRSLYLDVFNLFKIGLTYSLFLEAFKLGS
ncbi:DUF565 domain-containing protein [Pleurocapsales cyanobacterium LEGE 10410]|nr:DUF565 domain-containing protein [Pleurocapsales cyanobacterium LEGE 10410]